MNAARPFGDTKHGIQLIIQVLVYKVQIEESQITTPRLWLYWEQDHPVTVCIPSIEHFESNTHIPDPPSVSYAGYCSAYIEALADATPQATCAMSDIHVARLTAIKALSLTLVVTAETVRFWSMGAHFGFLLC